jgi:signal transduction histidine kinase
MGWHLPSGPKSLLVNARLLRAGHGHPATALVCMDDVTALKRAQAELEEAIRVRDAFLSIAGHELKTPLTTLQLQMQSMGRMALSGKPMDVDKSLHKIEAAHRQTERLAVLIGQLLDVSRINAGRLRLDLQPVDLAALVRDVSARFEDEGERVGSELVVRAAGRWVGRWDRERLDQVLTNLLSNALKYGRGKPVEISLDGDEQYARLVVRDHGIGIAPEDQARIFDRFERAVSDRHYGGLGLGLWIVREVVAALGGTIRVESTPGEGSLFTVELPIPMQQ